MTPTHKYVRTVSGAEELYDFVVDPFEMENRASDPDSGAVRDALAAELEPQLPLWLVSAAFA